MKIFSAEETHDKLNVGGHNPLLVCRYCFDMNLEISCLVGRTNQKHNKDQENRTKRNKLQESVQSGRGKFINI